MLAGVVRYGHRNDVLIVSFLPSDLKFGERDGEFGPKHFLFNNILWRFEVTTDFEDLPRQHLHFAI